jgi:hypothetical protein
MGHLNKISTINLTPLWFLVLPPRWFGSIYITVGSMYILLGPLGVISTVHKRHATLGFNQLHTGKNTHKKHDTKKIYQIFIYTSNIL